MRAAAVILICLLYGGANYYAAVRLFRLFVRTEKKRSGAGIAALFAALQTVALVSFGKGGALFAPVSVWLGILLYLILFFFAADLVLLIWKCTGHVSVRGKTAVRTVALILAALTVTYGLIHAGDIRTARYRVDTGKLREPVKIVLVSDIHLGAAGIESRLGEMAEAVRREEPDLVCIAGDIFSSGFSAVRDPEAVRETLRSIRPEYGVYACPGNHDGGEGYENMRELLSGAGITLLSEASVCIPDRCVICGRADSSPIGETDDARRPFDPGMLPGSGELPVIVLDHNPANAGEYGGEVSLVLCGHTHRGQVFPGSLITGAMYSVDYGMLPAQENRPAVIVTSGVGYWGPPMRVGSDSEIAVIELQ